jgi:hypothetical protein
MILDMTYEEVAIEMPVPTWEEFERTGTNRAQQVDFDRMVELARSKNTEIGDAFECERGFRYLLMVASSKRFLTHALAVDEFGATFDPECESSRKHWSRYAPLAFLKFIPKAS